MSVKGLFGKFSVRPVRHTREREQGDTPFETQRNHIRDVHEQGYQKPSRALVPQGSSDESHGTPHIHRVFENVERKTLYAVVHKDAKQK